MEHPTSFELNQAIRRWQDALLRSPHFRAGDLMELETHVRDSVAAFRAKGLTDEEAFLLATRRLGKPTGLEPEFAKVNRAEVWLNRLLWMLLGIQVWGLLEGLSRIVSQFLVLEGLCGLGFHFQPAGAGSSWGQGALPITFLSSAYLLVLATTLAGGWRVLRRKEMEAGNFLSRALRRPVFLGVLVTLGVLLVQALQIFQSVLWARHFSAPELGAIYLDRSISQMLLMLVLTVAFVALTISLLRRRFRPAPLAAA